MHVGVSSTINIFLALISMPIWYSCKNSRKYCLNSFQCQSLTCNQNSRQYCLISFQCQSLLFKQNSRQYCFISFQRIPVSGSKLVLILNENSRQYCLISLHCMWVSVIQETVTAILLLVLFECQSVIQTKFTAILLNFIALHVCVTYTRKIHGNFA